MASWIGADEYIDMAESRRYNCEDIAKYARAHGIDASWERVNRNYRLWKRWREGRIPTGYLIKQTGVKRIGHDSNRLRSWW